jgi:ATP-dependent DNA helicase RecG
VKQYRGKLTISNPGGFIGGISPSNILHHQPVARNPHLVDALTRLRLVNRSNLGVSRMFQELLIQGKEPPILEEQGEAVKVTFLAGSLSASFRAWVSEESELGRLMTVDHLLVLRYLVSHTELDVPGAARLCQRSELEARELLNEMEVVRQYLERGGSGRGVYYVLRPALHKRIAAAGSPERNRRIDWEAAKTRVLSVLKHRAGRGEAGLSNAEIRGITHFDSRQVKRLMAELKADGQVQVVGKTSNALWVYVRT